MNKILLTIIAIIVIAITIYTISNRPKTPQSTTSNTNTSIVNTPTYIDVEVKFAVQGRDISGKAVFEFPNIESCQANTMNEQSFIQKYKKECTEDRGCKSIRLGTCSSYVDEKYLSMLNKEFKDTHYMYLYDTRNTKERGVIVFWGLNEQEAKELCKANHKMKIDKTTATECL